MLAFAKGFLWGASTSSHQIEGGNTNDWSAWEYSAMRKALLETSANIEKHGIENYISGKACDSYHRYAEDFALAKSLSHNATRLSIEWSRIQPEEGQWNQQEIAHYRNVIQSARSNGLQVFVTLWHFTLPVWIAEQGGWKSRRTITLFEAYAERMTKELGDLAVFWITLNEPEIYAGASYQQKRWPPQEGSIVSAWSVLRNLAAAHKSAYAAMKKVNPGLQIGIAKNNVWFEAADPLGKLVAWCSDRLWNHWFLKQISKHQDFIGLNHYAHQRFVWGIPRNKNNILSDMGWELLPEAISRVLVDLKPYNVPIYITENGLADARDEKRLWFLVASLKSVHRAIQNGADVRGYLHWSLLDNFEWDSGFWPRFGLIEIDRSTLQRTPRHSAYLYKAIIEANGLTDQHLAGLNRRRQLLGLPDLDTMPSL